MKSNTKQKEASPPPPEDLMKLTTFITRYPDLASEGSIRWAVFHREKNALEKSGAITKGRDGRWYISPSRYREWLAQGGV